jgi:hypothetical protein
VIPKIADQDKELQPGESERESIPNFERSNNINIKELPNNYQAMTYVNTNSQETLA